jgi:hypothetical protein
MGKFFRNMHFICFLIVLGLFLGCGSDNGVTVQDTPDPPAPPDPPAIVSTFGVYSTPGGEIPNLYDTGGLVEVYVVHKAPEGAMAAEFRIQAPAGWVLVGTQSRYPTIIGDVRQGISIGYGRCATGSINLLALTYQTPGNAMPGAEFEVLPHPNCPENIQVVGCGNNELLVADGLATPVELWQFNPGTGTGDKPKPEEGP